MNLLNIWIIPDLYNIAFIASIICTGVLFILPPLADLLGASQIVELMLTFKVVYLITAANMT